MTDDLLVSRRVLLAGGVAASAALAGCSGGDEAADSPDAGENGSPDDSSTNTQTTPEDPTPSLQEFAYPAGAARAGIDAATLYETHRSTIVEGGSATVGNSTERTYSDFQSTTDATHRYSGDGTVRVTEQDGLTETAWSPAGESVAYVQMDTDFEQRYRIDTEAMGPERLLLLRRFENLLKGMAWGEASAVVDLGEQRYAARYESTGVADEATLLQAVFGQAVTEATASVAVTQDGTVGSLTYDVTVEREDGSVRQEATLTVGAVGDTEVQAPEWGETARSDGVRFDVQPTDDGRAVELAMTNGAEIAAGARLNFQSQGQFGDTQVREALSAGTRLYVGFSQSGELLVGYGSVPEGATQLDGFAFVAIRAEQYTLLERDVEL
jgi:hypothetical protein